MPATSPESEHELQDLARPQRSSADMSAADEEDPLPRNSTLTPPGEAEAEPVHDEQLQRRTLRKLDWILLPFLATLFLLNSLDKSNIGNAETAGFTHDAGLSRGDLNISMAAFFFVFVLLQPAGAALGRIFGMARYVPACMSLWGLSTVLHIFVRRRWQLILLRVVIAVLESGFYPTTVSYLSLFYTKFEFAWRLGFFYGMTAVSGALGGILAWAVFSRFQGHETDPDVPQVPPTGIDAVLNGEWKSWQILFLIEGCMTMTIALVGFLWLPHSAGSAWFFNAEEKQWAEQRMKDESHSYVRRGDKGYTEDDDTILHDPEDDPSSVADAHDTDVRAEAHDRLLVGTDNDLTESCSTPTTADIGLSRHDVVSAVFSIKIWHLLVVNILSAMPATAFNVLLPILVKELSPSLKLSPAASNLLSAPPFAFGAVVLFVFTAWSDRSQQRLVPIMWGLGILLLGLMLTILSPDGNYWLRYLSLCVLLSGSFIASPLTVAWLANNTPEPGKRAILLGINGWGNLAGVFMAVLFTPDERATGYIRSFIVLLICVVASFAGFIAFWVMIVRENKWREDVTRNWDEHDRQREEATGDVTAPKSFKQQIFEHAGLRSIAKKLGLREGRRGDEKLTYQYSL